MSQQSQVDFMEEVLGWDHQTCLVNLDSALPRILTNLEESAFIEEGIGILKVICSSLLPCVPIEELEDRLFGQMCKLTCSFIDSTLSKIQLNVQGALKDTTEEVKTVVIECLEWMMDIVQCVEACVKYATGVATSVELSSVQSLPSCAVHVLKQAYTHCKESTGFYGELLEHIAEPLSTLFKRTHSLQMSLLNMLDKVCISGAHLEDHVVVMCSVCTGLFEICSVATSLDVKLVISVWKGIAKLCSQHLNLLRDRFDVCPLINFLCEEVEQGYQYLFQLCPGADPDSLGDDKAFSKSVKILGFQMKVMVALLRDFADYLGSCEDSVLNLLLYIHRYLPPSLCATEVPEKQEGEVRVQIVNATVPIIGHLVENRQFRSGLTSHSKERSSEDRLPLLLLQLMVLDVLPKCEADVITHWLTSVNHNAGTPTRGLLSALFDSIQHCEVEMRVPVMLPGVMVDGKPQRKVSLYEHTATHICGFIGACLSQHFNILENTLLENVLGDSDLASLLATDCWCFLVRYGTADICSDQVQKLMLVFHQLRQKNSQANSKCSYKLQCLLQRLIKFMSPEHQAALVRQYPPDSDPHLWVALTLSCLNDDLAKSVGQKLVAWALSILHAKSGKASDVYQACQLFCDLLTGSPPLNECVSPQHQAVLLESICTIWSHIQATPHDIGPSREGLLTRLLPLTKCLLAVVETGDVLKVLSSIQCFLKTQHTTEFALAVAHFLSGFGTLRMAPSFQQSQVLDRLPQVFYSVLTHPHPLVHNCALLSFADFASHTMHEEAIPACIQGNEILQERIENFLNKVPYQNSHKSFALLDYLKSQVDRAIGKEKTPSTPMDHEPAVTKAVLVDKGEADKSDLHTAAVDSQLEARSVSDPPSKRARLADTETDTSLQRKEVTNINPPSSSAITATPAAQYQTFLQTLTSLAGDLELECSRSGPSPQWFTEAAKVALARINDCISPSSTWFDSLS